MSAAAQDVLDYIDHAEWRGHMDGTGATDLTPGPGVDRLLDRDDPPVIRKRVWEQLYGRSV